MTDLGDQLMGVNDDGGLVYQRSDAELLQELSDEYDKRCHERHVMGEEKYGPGTWLDIDTLEAAIDEIIDLGNYIRFTFIKLRLLQESLDTDKSKPSAKPGNERMGKEAQVPVMGDSGFISFRRDRT